METTSGAWLKTRSKPTGQPREDLPRELLDVLDLSLKVLKLDFERFLYFFLSGGGQGSSTRRALYKELPLAEVQGHATTR